MRGIKIVLVTLAGLAAVFSLIHMPGAVGAQNRDRIGERPTLARHINQADIEAEKIKLSKLCDTGEFLFSARWTKLDGQGRPCATGANVPTHRDHTDDPGFMRTSGTDSSSCADCHNLPAVGGAGGFAANVFVLAQNLNPVSDSVSADISNERKTLGMNGSGAIEMLAREMTSDLFEIRSSASAEARSTGHNVTKSLETKGVNFGIITARPDGGFDLSHVQGVDPDLIVKPFSQKGVVTSIRVFTVNAFNHHHGMEAVERFGIGQLDSHGYQITTNDFDGDGVPDELSTGDITAVTVFQAALNVPGRVLSDDPACRAAAKIGERLFSEIGCAGCHRPTLVLNNPVFSEPNPYNTIGNLRVRDISRPFSFDLTRDIPSPALERRIGGGAVVHAYTDLKRHVIADDKDPFFRNERVRQSAVPVDQFITRKLWDVGSGAPYGHRGDLTTITEAILHHAGEARVQRERFAALSQTQRNEIVEFLKQLQVLPSGCARQVTQTELSGMLKGSRNVKPVKMAKGTRRHRPNIGAGL